MEKTKALPFDRPRFACGSVKRPEQRHDDYNRFLVQELVDVFQPCIKSLAQYDPVVVGVDEAVIAVVVGVRQHTLPPS